MADLRDVETMCATHLIEQKTSSGLELTEAEERFAAEREPGTGTSLQFIHPPGMSQGRQSRVSVLAYGQGEKERRVVWKRMGADKGLTEAEAMMMWRRLAHYREKLISAGWKVPKLLYSAVVPVSSDETQIFSYEEYIYGGDAEAMLTDPEQPNFRKWYFVDKVLRTLYSYPQDSLRRQMVAGRKVSLLPDGLDLKAANFVLEEGTDELFFIDLFGPKELTDDGGWRIYSPKIDTLPSDNLRAVCATREGALLRFWRLARRLWKKDKDERVAISKEFLDHVAAIEPPAEELSLIQEEIETGCPWMEQLYKEHHI
jgi:hypothetical protein